MGSASNEYSKDILLASTGQTTTILSTTPITPWMALFSVAPADGSAGTELVGNGYVRVSAAAKFGTPTTASPSVVTNTAEITWPAATGSDWDAAVGWALFDASSDGNMLYHDDIASKTIVVGDNARIAIGDCTITQT